MTREYCGRARAVGKVALFLSTACAAWPAIAQQPSEGSVHGLEEIIVTAQKREERLQDVPISISAFSSETIEQLRIQNVKDLNALSPNVTVVENPGGSNAPSYMIRGVTGGGALTGTEVGVSLYVDGVYIGIGSGTIFDLADVSRIEVLKGPQGTLFGRNSTGGAINVTTRNPTGEFQIRQDFTYGNYDQFRSKTRIDFPALGPLSASVTYLHSQRHGDMRNLGAGTNWNFGPATGGAYGTLTSVKRFGDRNTNSVAAAVLFEPSQRFDLVYKFDYTHTDSSPTGVAPVILNDPAQGAGTLAAILASQPASNTQILSKFTSKRPNASNGWFTFPGFLKNYGHSLTANYEPSDSLTFKNILAYRKIDNLNISDQSGLGSLLTPAFFGPVVAGQPFIAFATATRTRQDQWTNELQASLHLEAFRLTTGFYYFDSDIDQGPLPNLGSVFAFMPVIDFTLAPTVSDVSHVDSRSTALYGQGEFDITTNLTAVAGLRQTWDRKDGSDNSRLATHGPLTVKYRDSRLTWLLGLNFKPNDDVLVYAKANTGFIGGGAVGGLPYLPETALSYETGVKADWLNRRVRTNLSLFHVTYKNQQFLRNLSGIVSLFNAGKARAWGGEFEGTFIPFKGLTLEGSLGHLNFKYLELDPAVGDIETFLPINRPKWTSTLSAQYEVPTSWGGSLQFRADANYRSSQNGINQPFNDDVKDASTIPSTWILNSRVSLTDVPIGKSGANMQIGIWGRNLTNNRSISTAYSIGFLVGALYESARTYGLDVTFSL